MGPKHSRKCSETQTGGLRERLRKESKMLQPRKGLKDYQMHRSLVSSFREHWQGSGLSIFSPGFLTLLFLAHSRTTLLWPPSRRLACTSELGVSQHPIHHLFSSPFAKRQTMSQVAAAPGLCPRVRATYRKSPSQPREEAWRIRERISLL